MDEPQFSHNPANETETVDQPETRAQADEPAKRLLSLDVFRGLTIVGMLLVNNIVLDYAAPKQFAHAAWNGGVHFADLVFPWFLFIVGVAVPYAAASFKRKGQPMWRYYVKVLQRAFTLVLLGCLIDSSIYRTPVFGLGVLQIIGLAYLVATLIYALPAVLRLPIAACLLISHWAVIRFIDVPGIGAGVFTETQNLIRYLDHNFLRSLHLRGLISVVPTSAMVLIGAAVGDMLRDDSHTGSGKTLRLFAGGIVLSAIGYLWNLDLPFNKPLWTASYIVFCAGLALLVLGTLYLVIDERGKRAWAFPLVVFGTNAILAYVLPILVKLYILQTWQWPMADGTMVSIQRAMIHALKLHAGSVTGAWLYTAGYILVWWLVLLQFYRKKVFLRV